VLVGFYTNDDSGWSANWLGEELAPGAEAKAEFIADTGACDQLLQIGWLGEDESEVLDKPISIDIRAVSNVYLDDNETYFDEVGDTYVEPGDHQPGYRSLLQAR
jgi:hypothetical protein